MRISGEAENTAVLLVRNWTKFQHYKNRCPPWIKLHTDTFQNPEFARLHHASKLLALCIWTLASRSSDGTVVDDFDYIVQWGFLAGEVNQENLEELISKGFIERASNTLATCKQNAMPEERQRRDREEGEDNSCSLLERDFEKLWNLWPRHEAKGKNLAKFKVLAGKYSSALILERAQKQVEIWNSEGKEKQFIPMLATWLNQKRFDTEPEFISNRRNGNELEGQATRILRQLDGQSAGELSQDGRSAGQRRT